MTATEHHGHETSLTPGRRLILLLVIGVAAALGWAVCSLPPTATGLREPAVAQLPNSGVTNPVTAAVLNYRGYDTLLEVAVLLLAVLGVGSVSGSARCGAPRAPAAGPRQHADGVLAAFVRWAVPLMILVAGYLLWIGSFAPGGAFQAGAVLAGAAILLLLAGHGHAVRAREALLRTMLILGLAVFAGVAAGVMAGGGTLLEYPRAHAGRLILLIESAALVSIATTLALLFEDGQRGRDVP